MMSNSSSTFPSSSSSSSFSSSAAPSSLQGATFQSRAVPPMPASMASMSSMSSSAATSNPGFISTTGLTSTGLPLTGERAGISQHGFIAPLHGADAMMAPASGGITLPAPIILGTHTTTSQQHMHTAPTMASHAPLATAAPLHHQQPIAPMPMSTTTTQTNIIQQQPIMATTSATATTGYASGLDRNVGHALDHGLEPRGTDRIHDREYGAEHRHDHLGGHAGTDMATTDKKLLKEREKEQHRLAKEQEKLAKERQHEQKQHEKDAKKHEKEMLKEQEHAAKEQEKLAKKHHKEELKAAKHHGTGLHTTGTTTTTTTTFPTKTDTMGYTAQPGMMHGATPLPGSSTTTAGLPVATGAPLGAVMASQGDYGRNAMLGEGHLAAVDLAKQQQLAGGIAAQPTGLQQPVGSINMADPPRHVF